MRPSSPLPRRPRSLRETLAYDNDMVVYKFMEHYRLSLRQARDLFTETKKWLWLCGRRGVVPSAPKALTIIGMNEMRMIDEMWHTFMLFTPVYEDFCHRYLGRFIHHEPTTLTERLRQEMLWRADPEKYEQEQLEAIRRELTFVGQELGPATIRKWFTTLGRKYTPEVIDRLHISNAASEARRVGMARMARRAQARVARA